MNETNNNQRQPGFDFLKYICAFMVICIHVSYRGKTTLEPLTRVAVPIFFMITGYFYSLSKEKGRLTGQIKKILSLTLFSNLGFILFDILLLLFQRAPLYAATAPWLTADAWINFLVFNTPPVWTHVWYLSALLYVLLLIFLFEKKASRKKLYLLIPILFCGNLILGTYSPLLFQKALPLEWSRNFLLTALPCFLLGDLLQEYKEKINLKGVSLIFIGVASILTTVTEHKLLVLCNSYVNGDFFISTPITAVALFLLAERCDSLWNKKPLRGLAFMGKEYSMTIFILHPVIIRLLAEISTVLSTYVPAISTIYFYTSPLIILLLSTLCAAGLSFFRKRKV